MGLKQRLTGRVRTLLKTAGFLEAEILGSISNGCQYKFLSGFLRQITDLQNASPGVEALFAIEQMRLGPNRTLVAALAVGSPGLRPGLRSAAALEIERHSSTDEIPQRGVVNLVAFVDVDGAPDISLKAGVE